MKSIPYRLEYRWWRNHARTSADPKTCLRYALNQLRLARAIDADPVYFDSKPLGYTDWEWYQRAATPGSEGA